MFIGVGQASLRAAELCRLQQHNEELQAVVSSHNEEVAVLVKALEEIDPSLGLKTIANVVVYAAAKLRAMAASLRDLQETVVRTEAEANEQRRRADEQALSVNAHVLHRQKLAVAMEREFGMVCGGGSDETPENAAIERIRSDAKTIADLRIDLAEAEAESSRFSKENRQMSARAKEIFAEVEGLRSVVNLLVDNPVKDPLNRIPSDPPLDLMSALARAKAAATLATQREVIDLTPYTRAPMTGDSFETFAGYFIVEAVCAIDRAAGTNGEGVAAVFSGENKTTKAEVCLVINGVRVPFVEVLRRFHEDWERCTRATAVEIVQGEFNERTMPVYELLDGLREQLERHLGVPKDEET